MKRPLPLPRRAPMNIEDARFTSDWCEQQALKEPDEELARHYMKQCMLWNISAKLKEAKAYKEWFAREKTLAEYGWVPVPKSWDGT